MFSIGHRLASAALLIAAILIASPLALTGCGGGSGTAPATVTAPAITLSSSSLTFSSQPVATTSASQSITLTNSGTSALIISSISVAGDFTQTNNCTSIAVNATCTLQVAFQPSAPGTRTGALTINANTTAGQAIVSLTGTGVQPAIALNPTSLTFSGQPIATPSVVQSITVTNSGTAPLIFTGISITGDYTQTNNCTTVAVNATCTVQVVFQPTVTGTRTGTLTLNGNFAAGQATVSLSGTGTQAAITLNPSILNFSAQAVSSTSPPQPITVTNSGTAPLTVSSISTTGDFSQTNNCTGVAIAVNATCTVQVVFQPTAPGTRTGTLTLNANIAGGQATANLSGSTTQTSITLNPTGLTFPAQAVSTVSAAQPITVTNTGAASLTITRIIATGDYSETDNCTAAAIAANAACTVQVYFQPTTTGTRTGTLTLYANIAGGQITANLTGSALTPASVILSSSALTFPATFLTTSSASQSITLSNPGGFSATLQAPSLSGDFAFTANTCGASLAAGATCTVFIDFAPTATGSRTGSFSTSTSVGTETASLTGTGTTAPTGTYTGSSFSGKVLAGQAAIVGATVQIYSAGTAGNGSQGWPMLSAPPVTDATGSFTIPGTYSCPLSTSQVYLVARGGHLVSGSSSNTAIALLAPLGLCNQITTSTQVELNEATTAVSAWAMAQFLSAGGNLGSTATNTTGIANAVASVNNLVNLATGVVPGATFPTTGTAPKARINTLANLLNTCTTSITATSCAQLFTQSAIGSMAPANVLDAVMNIVQNPANNVAALYTLAGASTAFTPALTAKPSDWTLFVTYGGGGMNAPTGIGVDSKGNVWVASYFDVASEFTTTGQPIFATGITGNGLDNSYGLAVDGNDYAWIPNESNNSITVLNTAGTRIGLYTGGGMNFPVANAIDNNATTWVVNYGNSTVSKLSSTGTSLSVYSSSSFDFPVAVAIDSNHNAYIANQSDDNITKISPAGAFTTITCCDGASGLAVDQQNNVWAANYYGNSVSEISSSGSVLNSNITGGGINHPQGIAVDGAGTVWVANFRGPSLTELAGATNASPGTALSPAAGWAPDAALLEAYAIAIDPTGNLWVSNFGSNTSTYTITEFIGLAAPIKTAFLGPPQAP